MTSTSKPGVKYRKNISEKRPDNTKRRMKKSLKTVEFCVRLGKRLAVKSVETQNELNKWGLFGKIMAAHELCSSQMISIEKDSLKTKTQVPKMSREMRKILSDLDKCHLVDDLDPILEQTEESAIPSTPDNSIHFEKQEETSEAKELRRPKWNNFIGSHILPSQRFVSNFSTEIASRRDQIEREHDAQRQAIKKHLIRELKLPKVSPTTEDLIMRRTSLDKKIQIMRICHANGMNYNEEFIAPRPRSFAFLPSSFQRMASSKIISRRRTKSCQPSIDNLNPVIFR